jgi:hypothetical protein
VLMFRTVVHPLERSRFASSFALLCAVGLAGALTLSGCSSEKAADTSAASAVAFTTAVAPETTALSAESTAGVVETSVAAPASETSAASADSVPADGATPTSADPQAAMEAAIVSGMSSQLGVTDPKQLACVTDSVKGVDFAKPEGQGKILRSMLKCAPDAMAVQGATALRESNPKVTEEQSVCIVKATFEVLGGMADSELVAAMSSSKLSLAIVESTLAKAKGCGLSEAEIRKAIQQ